MTVIFVPQSIKPIIISRRIILCHIILIDIKHHYILKGGNHSFNTFQWSVPLHFITSLSIEFILLMVMSSYLYKRQSLSYGS